jgi:hypothetical protein
MALSNPKGGRGRSGGVPGGSALRTPPFSGFPRPVPREASGRKTLFLPLFNGHKGGHDGGDAQGEEKDLLELHDSRS